MLCATLLSPEQNPPSPVYLSLFNIYAYLNQIFKDREREGAPDSWILPSNLQVSFSYL